MAPPPKGASGATVSVDRAALQALKNDLAHEREDARRLKAELTAEVEFARKAAEQTLEAREEREQFRRVLAAAVANEKRSQEGLEETLAQIERLEPALLESERGRGEAEGRARELHASVQTLGEEHRHRLREATDLAQANLELHFQSIRALEEERSFAQGRVHELELRVPAPVHESARATALRGRLCLGGAAFAVFVFFVLLGPLVHSVINGTPQTHPGLGVGLSGWKLLGLEALAVLAAIGLTTWGRNDLRRAERGSARLVSSERARTDGIQPNSPRKLSTDTPGPADDSEEAEAKQDRETVSAS